MKKVLKAIKDYKYKFLTLLASAGASAGLLKLTGWNIFEKLIYASIIGLFLVSLYSMYKACKNAWEDGSKAFAIIYGVLGYGSMGFIAYLVLKNLNYII